MSRITGAVQCNYHHHQVHIGNLHITRHPNGKRWNVTRNTRLLGLSGTDKRHRTKNGKNGKTGKAKDVTSETPITTLRPVNDRGAPPPGTEPDKTKPDPAKPDPAKSDTAKNDTNLPSPPSARGIRPTQTGTSNEGDAEASSDSTEAA